MAQKSCATPCDEIEKGCAEAQPLPRRSPSQTTGSSTMASPNRSRLRRGAGCPTSAEDRGEDVLRDDTIGLDFVGVDGARCDFRGTDVTTGVPDLDVPRVMHLADDLIGVDTVRVDGVGANLVGLDLIRVDYLGWCRQSEPRRCGYDLRSGRRNDDRGRRRLRLRSHFNSHVVSPYPPDRQPEGDEPSDCGCDPCTTLRHHFSS